MCKFRRIRHFNGQEQQRGIRKSRGNTKTRQVKLKLTFCVNNFQLHIALNYNIAFLIIETKKLMEKEKDLPKQIILEKMELIEKYVAKTEGNNEFK